MHLLNLQGDTQAIEAGARVLSAHLDFELSANGMAVGVSRRPGALQVRLDGARASIACQTTAQFFRGLGLLLDALRAGRPCDLQETPHFSMVGAMFDASRNAVLTVSSIKRLLRSLALMGFNAFMLYTEDTYAVAQNPYQGYFRGRYSQDELTECDAYAAELGIEMIPCIQTLGHVEQILKWDNVSALRDTSDIFLVGEPETYRMLEAMIRAVSGPMRSQRIHIGMDEAHRLGLGSYLARHGYRGRFQVMNEHLSRVLEISRRHDLRPMIWSDMYFRLASATGDYYDFDTSVSPEAVIDQPQDVQLVYWDYYHERQEDYAFFIRKHRKLGIQPVFAGGVWTWNGPAPNYTKTWAATNAALSACRQEGVQEVFACMWADDGAEANLFTSLPGLQLFAEYAYGHEPTDGWLRQRFSVCGDGGYDGLLTLDRMDNNVGAADPPHADERTFKLHPPNPSKYLLWQDILLGQFDLNVQDRAVAKHYAALAADLRAAAAAAQGWHDLLEVYGRLATVLSLKGDVGLRAKAAYDAGQRDALRVLAEETLPALRDAFAALHAAHRELWMRTYKPFGWEVLDLRYGGARARVEAAIERLSAYLRGEVDVIEELEQERLFFDERCNQYRRIVTTSYL